MACSATGAGKTTENPKWKVKTFSQCTLELQTKTLIVAFQEMEDWGAEWDMDSWDNEVGGLRKFKITIILQHICQN